MNILITICARGGSKGIPGKNIKLINGVPLIAYTIELAKKFQKKYINSTPLNRMCFEEDIIYLILFLLSDMSKYITGQNLFVDGGYSIL